MHPPIPLPVVPLVLGLLIAGCSSQRINPDTTQTLSPDEGCTADDLKAGTSPFLTDDASSDLRAKLETVIAVGDIAIVRATCDKGIEVLEGCTVRGNYNFVGLTPSSKTLVMRDQAQALANLGAAGQRSLSVGFDSGRELVVEYRLVGKYKTTIPGVTRAQLEGVSICQGATHFVTSMDVGAFSSFFAERDAVNAQATFDSFGGSASGGSELSDKVSAGSLSACPQGETLEPSAGCSATIRMSLVPIEEALVGEGGGDKKPATADCRSLFVLNDDGICVAKDSTAVYVCDPTNYEECEEMCLGKDGVYSKQSCNRLANISMQLIERIRKEDSEKSKSLTDIVKELLQREGFEEFVKTHGERFQEVCESMIIGSDNDAGKACALAFINLAVTQKDADNDTLFESYGLLSKGCSSGEQFSCEVFENFLASDNDTEAMKSVYERHGVEDTQTEFVRVMTASCRNGNGRSCFRLSKEHVNGETAFLDLVLASTYAERGCHAGLSHACVASGAMKLGNASVCSRVLTQYTAGSQTQHMEKDGEADSWYSSMVIDAVFAQRICLKSSLSAETEEIKISDLRSTFELFQAGCELEVKEKLKSKSACAVSYELYKEIVDREIQRINALEALNRGGQND